MNRSRHNHTDTEFGMDLFGLYSAKTDLCCRSRRFRARGDPSVVIVLSAAAARSYDDEMTLTAGSDADVMSLSSSAKVEAATDVRVYTDI